MEAGNDEFRIIIVGGGIAGLAAGIALRGANRSITILERSRMLKETGALISLQPNASKIVTQWGLDVFLKSAEPLADRGFRLFDKAGQVAREVPLSTDQFGADRVLYHRQDLHFALRDAAVSCDLPGAPVKIMTASLVVSCDPDNGLVTLDRGETLEADLLIGADGIKSVTRAAVLGKELKATPTGISAYRILVPAQSLRDIEGVPDSVKNPEPAMTSMVVGEDKRVIMGPGRGGKLFGIVALVPDDKMQEKPTDESWVRPGSKKRLLEAYADFPAWLRAIFNSAPDEGIGLWQLRDFNPLPTWVRGRTIIIGDAAHAMLPTQGQGASQSIEDAEALQAFFANVQARPSKGDVQEVLEKVFRARYERVSLIQTYSRQQAQGGTAKGSIAVKLDPGQFMRYNSAAQSYGATAPATAGPSAAATEPTGSAVSASSSKRIRLSLACNQCRKRKVRCDTEIPKCRNCWLRDEECETTDPRYPEGGPTVRRWATKDGLLPGQNPAATHRNQASVPKHSPTVTATATVPSDRDRAVADRSHGGINAPRRWSTSASISAVMEASAQQRDAISASPASADSSAATVAMSWVSRGYHHSISVGGGGASAGEDSVNDANPDLVVNTDSSSHRVKYMGGSSLQCLALFVDIYLRRKGLPIISSNFRNGMRYVEEYQLSLATPIPPLPALEPLRTYLDTFFTRVWPVYPVVDRASVEADIQHFHHLEYSAPAGLQANLTSAHIPQLVSIFSIIVIAADEAAGEITELGNAYLDAAYSLFAHLAIRIAHSIGLHRFIRPWASSTSLENLPAGYQVDLGLHGRVWWSCYAMEKLMELETGRPSAINDEDIDQVLPPAPSPADNPTDFFSYWVRLAKILSQISKHLYRQKPDSAWQLMSEIGSLDQQLQEWANVMPEGIKPGHELFASHGLGQQPYQQHVSGFLSLQYYQAQITLLRASLIFPTSSFTDEVKRLGPSLPSYVRLLQSENICTGAARSTVRQVLELDDHGIHSRIWSVTQPFLAAVVLALHIVKNPSKRLVRSDLELLITATEHLEVQFRRGGQHPSFVRGFETLRASVSAAVSLEQQQQQGSVKSTPPTSEQHRPELGMAVSGRDAVSLVGDQSFLMPSLAMPDLTSFEMGEDIPLDELWSAIGTYSFLEPSTLDEPPLPGP
ncbi:3-hydroxybenzoate 6-hydroxylase 1 [Pleurostoma richardsiae]|uniref:3-hydroxybenzoate 6-hydroxylase 1 n=1 Tax=Pleurostoma richardsiae TaxID=41990 RepID=A0AA38RMP7_9PEZI|nr:3-hydroxybenzoate 6-hydroxylase 1 [Pleurostoma richardsiae]